MRNRKSIYQGTRPDDLCRAIKGDFEPEEGIREIPPELQIQKLIEWGEECSHCVDFDKLIEYSDNTAEHKVWCDVENSFAIKQTIPGNYGFIPQIEAGKLVSKSSDVVSYLERLHLQNEIFGDEVIVLGVLPKERSLILFEPDGVPILTCQPWYYAADSELFPTEEEVHVYLTEFGFTPIKDAFYGWVNKELNVYVLDAKPDNFILTKSGVQPIDLQIARIE